MTTEAEIRSWIAGYPRAWNGLCQALMWQLCNRFGSIASTPASAIDAYRVEAAAGRIRGGTPPPGTFVYFDIGADGHVGFMLNGGRIFMASGHIYEQWTNTDAGPQYLDAYTAATGATYLGWSTENAGNLCPFTADGGGTTPGTESEDDMSYIKIQGKGGAWRGGTYAVFANGGGAYSAVFIGSGGPTNLDPVTDESAIQALQGKISGLA